MVLVRDEVSAPSAAGGGLAMLERQLVGTPYDPGRDEVSASPSQRCDIGGVGAVAPPLHADGQLHPSA